jgi:hypothetical protein
MTDAQNAENHARKAFNAHDVNAKLDELAKAIEYLSKAVGDVAKTLSRSR